MQLRFWFLGVGYSLWEIQYYFLFNKGHLVSVVNPMQIKSFAKSELLRTKNDSIDSQLIMRFCERMKPTFWEPEPENISELKSLQKRYDDLQNMILQEENRKESDF